MIVYKLSRIPDMTLSKYQSFEDSGIEGMLKAQERLIKQLHRAMVLIRDEGKGQDLSIHFLYDYKSGDIHGKRLNISILIRDKNVLPEYVEKIEKVIRSSGIYDYYSLSKVDSSVVHERSFPFMTVMNKKERYLQAMLDNQEQFFYVVPNWKINEESRLYNLFRLMQTVNEDCSYRVDLYVEKGLGEIIHKNFEKPLSFLRNSSLRDGGISELSRLRQDKRDPNADETLRQYEDWLKSVDGDPTFLGRICAFANDQYYGSLLIDSAVAECISSGDVRIKTLSGAFNNLSQLSVRPQNAGKEAPASMKWWPTTYLSKEISAFARFPVLYDGEVIEVPKETLVKLNTDGIKLGVDENKLDVKIPFELFSKHMFICGVPGSGKTNTMLHIANSLWNTTIENNGESKKSRIPFLILEPAKHEYRELANLNISDLIIFSPSANTNFPLQINPFEFPKNVTLSEHIGRLCQVFEGAFPIAPPAPFILDRAIQAIYEKYGWDSKDINTGEKEYPTMSELYEQFEKELAQTNYDSEIQGNIQSVLQMRIGSLLRREMKEIFDVKKSTFPPEEWLRRPVLVELESLAEGPANFITLLLCTLIREVLKTKTFNKEQKIRHLIFIEEAHNLIASESQAKDPQDSNPKIAATAFIVKMLAEVRALGEGIIIADQLPSAMAPEVIKNTNIKIVHRLTAQDDRELIGSTMTASPLQLENIATFVQGQALITYEKMLRPFQMQVDLVPEHEDESSDDEKLFELMKRKTAFREMIEKREVEKFYQIKREALAAIEQEQKAIDSLVGIDCKKMSTVTFEQWVMSHMRTLEKLHTQSIDLTYRCKVLSDDFVHSDKKNALLGIVMQIGAQFEKGLNSAIVTIK